MKKFESKSMTNSNLMRERKKKKKTRDIRLYDLTELLKKEMKSQLRERTARAYHSATVSLLTFTGKEDLLMSELTTSLLVRYEQSLLSRGRCLNTISFYMRNLRSIYNRGVERRLFTSHGEDLFRMVYTGVTHTRKRAARQDDICKITQWLEKEKRKNTPAADPDPLHLAGYYFLFCFYARGMSYVDMAYLKKTDIRNGVIHYRRRKTGQYLEISLTRELKSILSFFSPFVKGSPYLFPVIRSKEKERVQYENGLRLQNHYLKKLTHTLGLSAPLSMHVVRHTWATIAKKRVHSACGDQ